MPRSPDEIAFLRDLVAIPSVSGEEAEAARFTHETAVRWGLPARRTGHGVVVAIEGNGPGPTLALVSHLDTVPPGYGWTRGPFGAEESDGRLYGRGASDAKASVASMLAAASDAAERGIARGRLLVVFGFGEETRATTMGQAIDAEGPVDAAVVGEPTSLDVAVAQRGLLMIDLVARGEQRHAGHAGEAGFLNATIALARDLVRLDGLFDGREHRLLGTVTATPTWLEAGIGRNVTPPVARALLDVRSTPDWSHDEIAAVLRGRLDSEVVVASDRLVPCETPPNSRLLAVTAGVRPEARRFGSATSSDWVFLRGADTVKCGPGDTRRSHTADEWVDLDEVRAARAFYAGVAAGYLA